MIGGASVEFGDVLTTKSWRCFSNETCGLQPELRWQSERPSEAAKLGPLPPSAGSRFCKLVQGLGTVFSAGGHKQLVPVGITDWLNFTLSGNGPELEAASVKEPTT